MFLFFFLPSITSLFPRLPIKVSFCTAPHSSFLSAKLDAAQFIDFCSNKLIKFVTVLSLSFNSSGVRGGNQRSPRYPPGAVKHQTQVPAESPELAAFSLYLWRWWVSKSLSNPTQFCNFCVMSFQSFFEYFFFWTGSENQPEQD